MSMIYIGKIVFLKSAVIYNITGDRFERSILLGKPNPIKGTKEITWHQCKIPIIGIILDVFWL
ncbi:hypothetical protein CER18_00535 [Bartonella tribocorum]|uniref:Uncharacterized protein n=1 Tax=Bartonella tribocorum TaxID=85701 RepID=A0A2M6UVR4_9HYPH|nr:hypothetical protein CER18_00535 [Bartonella tribocorum]